MRSLYNATKSNPLSPQGEKSPRSKKTQHSHKQTIFFFLIKKRSSRLWRMTGLGSSILRACVAIHLLGLPDTPNSVLSATLAPAPWHLLDCVAHTAEEQSLCSGLTCCKAFSCPGPTQSLQLFKSLGDQANITHPKEDYAASKT